jgi:hypothetical protein
MTGLCEIFLGALWAARKNRLNFLELFGMMLHFKTTEYTENTEGFGANPQSASF